jgi:hypothetical protein
MRYAPSLPEPLDVEFVFDPDPPRFEATPPSPATRAAVRLNRQYARSLGWGDHRAAVARLVGATSAAPETASFAGAVAVWQRRNRLAADGVIGPATWRRMRSALGVAAPSSGRTAATSCPGVSPTLPRGPFATLVVSSSAAQGVSYPFTASDVLWTARFIVGEAGGRDDADNRAVIWAMINRFGLRAHAAGYKTFAGFLRAYSTTLQPVLNSWGAARRHMHSPEFKRTGGTYEGRGVPPGIPKGQLRRHLTIQELDWKDITPCARRLAERALTGGVPNPIGLASQFANTATYWRDRHGRAPTREEWTTFTEAFARTPIKGKKGVWRWIGDVPGLDQYGKNAFFVEARDEKLPNDAVRLVSPR